MAAGLDENGSSSFYQEIAVLSFIQFTIIVISSLFANYLFTDVTFVSRSVYSFKIFAVVFCSLTLGLLLSRSKKRWTFTHLLKLPVIVGCCTLSLHIIAVLYGAPFLSKTEETAAFALVMALLTCLPVCCILGAELDVIYRVFISNWCECTLESYFQCCVLVTVIGAWLGALPIPLDWDRPWQVWPITCVVGGILGNTLGLLGSGLVFCYYYGKDRRKRL